jgi:leader peptidase (prepilin peptidase) / N-methyltransferase
VTLPLAEALALGTATGAWNVAVRAAQRRAVTLGDPPYVGLAILAAVAALRAPAGAAYAIVLGGVAVAAVCDARTGLVFTPLTALLGVAALVAAVLEGRAGAAGAGTLAAGGALFALYALTSGRGIGLGDVRLACAVGAALGALAGLIVLGWAFVLGGTYAAMLLATRRARPNSELRFAPFIAAAFAVAPVP